MSVLRIRRRTLVNAAAFGRVFCRAIRDGAALAYSDAQRRAWWSLPPTGLKWDARLARRDTIAAVRAGRVVGFVSLDLTRGIPDHACLMREESGHGTATALYAAIDGGERAIHIAILTRIASEPARRFFLRLDWRAIARPESDILGVGLQNCRLEKSLIGNGVRAA